MPKVSVIIPVYNSGQYIRKCMESVINQSIADIEIICVDDGSTDCSKNILEQYVKIDDRITVLYNEENKGQSFSRNKALEAATGEYIQFLDSDDYLIGEDALEFLYLISKEKRLDLCKIRWVLTENGVEKITDPYPEDTVKNVCTGKDLLYQLEYQNICARTTCSNFVKRDFLIENGIKFRNGIIHEDVLYSFELFYFAERAVCVNKCTYAYIRRADSTTSLKDIRNIRGYFACMNEIMNKNYMQGSIKCRYATIKYLIRIYYNILSIIKNNRYTIEPEMLEDELGAVYKLFFEKETASCINFKTITQNINKISTSEKLYVYGAGRAAKELLVILEKNNISIDGVFVTDTDKSAKVLMGHKVLGIEDCNCSDKNAMFLVAITKMYVGNVVDLLYTKGYENVIYVC